jgi:hypothetical protein
MAVGGHVVATWALAAGGGSLRETLVAKIGR